MRVDSHDYLRLVSVKSFSSPFNYFISSEAFKPQFAGVLLDWLETTAPWELVVADFYEQYEFSFWNVTLPSELTFLIEAEFINNLRNKVSAVFKTHLAAKVDIAAHKLIPGQRIRLHNDFIAGHETHRLLIQLNRGWSDDDGGLLILFNSSDPADICKAFRPIHNSALGFSVSLASNHAVSAVHGGERFTVVFSFFSENRNA